VGQGERSPFPATCQPARYRRVLFHRSPSLRRFASDPERPATAMDLDGALVLSL
jgi:hypothetical protein